MLIYVDCAIPCNNRNNYSIAMIWYLLTKAVLEIKKEEEGFEKNPSAYVNVELENKKKGKKEEQEEEGKEGEEEEEAGGDEGEGDNKDEDGGEEEGEDDEDDGDKQFL